MNTDKTLNEKFIENKEYPIWYYKELKSVKVNHVIFYLLKEPYVVDINGSKHEITFGKNRKGEIGQCIRYDDIKNSKLCSFEVVEKGFREGRWFTISDTDTSNEFKDDYNKRKTQYEKEETKQWYKSILNNVIERNEDLDTEQKNIVLQQIENYSYEELENFVSVAMKNSQHRNVFLKDNLE